MLKLTDDEKLLYDAFQAREPSLTDVTFTEVLLRGSARNFAEAREAHDRGGNPIDRDDLLTADRELRRHAVLYTYALAAMIYNAPNDPGGGWADLLERAIVLCSASGALDVALGGRSIEGKAPTKIELMKLLGVDPVSRFNQKLTSAIIEATNGTGLQPGKYVIRLGDGGRVTVVPDPDPSTISNAKPTKHTLTAGDRQALRRKTTTPRKKRVRVTAKGG